DDRGLLASETLDYDTQLTSNPEFTTNYEYDSKGRLSTIGYPQINGGNRQVSYEYTNRGQLWKVSYDNGSNNLLETRSYDAGGLLESITRPQFNETRMYDNANRLDFIENLKSGASPNDQIGRLTYGYDKNGNKTSEMFSGGPAGLARPLRFKGGLRF
ncbi:MAG: hypothetical protein AAGA30_19460, partial [Planctomycetota bacterium]